MSHYNAEYENYYRNLTGNKNLPHTSREIGRNSLNIDNRNRIARRIIQEFAGTLILFAIVILCKAVVTPQTAAVYNYGKKIVNDSYDFKVIETRFNEIKNDPSQLDIQLKIEEWFQGVTDQSFDLKSLKNKIREKFFIPVDSSITYNKENEIVLILAQLPEGYSDKNK